MSKITRTATLFGVAGCMLLWMASQSLAANRPIVDECMRCHDVKTYQYELSYSAHAVDKDKRVISCEQCHDSHFNSVTDYYARDEYFDKKIFKPEDFDRKRMQQNANQAVPSKNCQVCHIDLSKNGKGEPISERGQVVHDAFLGKNGTTNKTCAGCHINVAHLPEFDFRLNINADFAKKLTENPMAPASNKEGK